MGGRPRVCHLESGEHQTVIVNGEETAGHLTGDCANVVGAAAIGGPFFVRPFLSERDFAKPTTSITIPARAAYPHAFNLVLATFAAAMPSSLAFPDKLLRHSLRQWTAGAVMGRLLNEILLRSHGRVR